MSNTPASKDLSAMARVRKLRTLMSDANTVICTVHTPIAELAVIATKLDGYMGEGLAFTGFVDDLLGILKTAIQICRYLGGLIPTIGPILANTAKYIEGLGVEDTVRKVVHEMRTIIEKVCNVQDVSRGSKLMHAKGSQRCDAEDQVSRDLSCPRA
jgi:hypothetical protein